VLNRLVTYLSVLSRKTLRATMVLYSSEAAS
jgi:hypothetical protein